MINAKPILPRAWPVPASPSSSGLTPRLTIRPSSSKRDTLALLEAASKQHTRLVNQLHGLLARVFPELAVHVKDLSASYLLTLLDKYPTPEKLARAKPETLAKIPHLDQETAQTLQAAAAQSLGSNQGALAEQLVRQKVRAIRQQQTESAELQKLVEQAWKALPEGTHRRIRSIPGIGPQTAAALVAKIVSIDRFETAKALIGYFGVFPEEVDVSGADRHGNPKQGTEIHKSRKGNDRAPTPRVGRGGCSTRPLNAR
jgi:transposase